MGTLCKVILILLAIVLGFFVLQLVIVIAAFIKALIKEIVFQYRLRKMQKSETSTSERHLRFFKMADSRGSPRTRHGVCCTRRRMGVALSRRSQQDRLGGMHIARRTSRHQYRRV